MQTCGGCKKSFGAGMLSCPHCGGRAALRAPTPSAEALGFTVAPPPWPVAPSDPAPEGTAAAAAANGFELDAPAPSGFVLQDTVAPAAQLELEPTTPQLDDEQELRTGEETADISLQAHRELAGTGEETAETPLRRYADLLRTGEETAQTSLRAPAPRDAGDAGDAGEVSANTLLRSYVEEELGEQTRDIRPPKGGAAAPAPAPEPPPPAAELDDLLKAYLDD